MRRQGRSPARWPTAGVHLNCIKGRRWPFQLEQLTLHTRVRLAFARRLTTRPLARLYCIPEEEFQGDRNRQLARTREK